VLFYPLFFYTAGTLYPQMLGTFLFLAFISPLLLQDTRTTAQAIVAGVACGWLILTIPTFLFFLVATNVFLFISRKKYLTPITVFVTAVFVVGLWTFRNFVVFDSFVLISTNSGLNLLLGNSEHSTANSGVNADVSKFEHNATGMSEIERDRYFRSRAIEFIRDNPRNALMLYLKKTANFFNYRNDLFVSTESSPWRDWVMLLTFGPLLGLFVTRICLFRVFPFSELEKYLSAAYLSSAFLQAVFFTRIRFRVPFDFLLIAEVAILLSLLSMKVVGKEIPKLKAERFISS
jgi:hypothetical protein